MAITKTQGVFGITSLDPQNINPSLMEGERFYSSLIGPGAAVPIVRYAPTFTANPVVTGDTKIPSILTCSDGTVTASPKAVLTFQWKSRGVDIPGETANTYLTAVINDTESVTCQVTATNTLGSDTAISNGIVASILEPMNLMENSFGAVTGLQQKGFQNLIKGESFVLSGLSVDTRLDNEQNVVYIGTGLPVGGRQDTESLVACAVEGLPEKLNDVVYSSEVGAIWKPVFVEDLAIINPGAETGDMTGWTIDFGGVTAVTSAAGSVPTDGSYMFKGDDLGANGDSQMSQVVVINGANLVAIDANQMLAIMGCSFDNSDGVDGIKTTMEFLNAADGVLGTEVLGTHIGISWKRDVTDLVAIPALTRKIKITVFFEISFNVFLNENNGYADSIDVGLYSYV